MSDENDPAARDLDDRPRGEAEQKGTGVSRWSLLLLVLALLLAIIIGQNTEKVTVEVLWAEFETPLFLVVLLAGLGVTAIWEIGTLVLRHRRRRARRG